MHTPHTQVQTPPRMSVGHGFAKATQGRDTGPNRDTLTLAEANCARSANCQSTPTAPHKKHTPGLSMCEPGTQSARPQITPIVLWRTGSRHQGAFGISAACNTYRRYNTKQHRFVSGKCSACLAVPNASHAPHCCSSSSK